MKVKLLHNTPLWICSTAIRKCWASEDKSDSMKEYCSACKLDITGLYLPSFPDGMTTCPECGTSMYPKFVTYGDKDKELIERVGNKHKHSSTLEHLNYTFDIDGISRALLQELVRHRHASYSIKSSRYTLKELKDTYSYEDFLVSTGLRYVDKANIKMLKLVQEELKEGLSNDIVKYCLPEAYKTSLVMTINARSLQNLLQLRTSPSALKEFQLLAKELFNNLPEEHKYLFEGSLYKKDTE